MTAVEVGNDPMALSVRQRLGPLLDGIADPLLRPLCQMAMAWTYTIGEDLNGALREASASLGEFRGQDEPVWTTSACLTLGSIETTIGEALGQSLAAHSTRSVTLCLAAFARWALVAGDAERAALVAGAAEGLRRRAGLRAWPILRPGEAELVAQARQALGADRFDQVFATGARLTQREAVAAAGIATAPAPR